MNVHNIAGGVRTVLCDATGNPLDSTDGALKVVGTAIGGEANIPDGGDETQGHIADAAVVTDASGTMSGKLRGVIAILLRAFAVGTPVRVDPVGSTAQPVTGPLTDTQLRATAVPVSGTLTVQQPTASSLNATVVQNVVISTVNDASGETVASGATWTGAFESTLGVAGIQVNVTCDKPATLYVDQSMAGTNADLTDEFHIQSGVGFSTTVQATASYVRLRVTNLGATDATLTTQLALCPIVEAVPRALDQYDNLRTSIGDLRSGDFETAAMVTPTHALRTTQSSRLVGATFQGSTLDARYWTASVGTGGSAGVSAGELTLSTGSTASANTASVLSNRVARYVAANVNCFRAVVVLPAVTTTDGSCTRRWGALNATDGYYFEAVQAQGASSPTLQLNVRKTTDGTPVTVFNGEREFLTLDTLPHTYEIYWSNKSVWFFVDGELLHKVSSGAASLVNTQHLPVGLYAINGTGNQAANTMVIRVASISRLGPLATQPQYYYQSGTTAGVAIKAGVGNLHKIIVGSQANGSVITLYDNTSASAPVIFAFTYSQGPQANNQPFVLDFGGIPFSTGLFLVIGTANSNVCVIYE